MGVPSQAYASIKLFSLIGLVFGGLASLMAYIIFYREYIHRFEHVKARSMALRGALSTLFFFVGLAVASGFVIGWFVLPSRP